MPNRFVCATGDRGGPAAPEAAGQTRKYQANTIRTRRMQSLSKLGGSVLADNWKADPVDVLLDGRSRVFRFARTGIQLRLPHTTLHDGNGVERSADPSVRPAW